MKLILLETILLVQPPKRANKFLLIAHGSFEEEIAICV